MALKFLNDGYFAGKVGIGTLSPERLLSLYSDNAETTPRLLIEQDGTGDAVMAFSLTSGQGWAMGIDNSGADAFMIHNSAGGVDSSSQFAILPNGNVGIGTTSPSGIFEVFQQATGRTAGDLLVDATSKYTYVGRLSTTSGDVSSFKVRDRLNRAYFDVNTASKYISFNPEVGDITMQIASGYGFKINGGQFLVNATNGNVGIGTTSPATKLHVNGDIGAYTSDWVATVSGSRLLMKTFAGTGDTYSLIQAQDVGGSSNNALVLQPYGDNVGIGTTSPGYKLQVDGGTLNTIANFKSTDNGSFISFSDNTTTSGEYVQIGASGNGMVIRTGNAQQVTVLADGNVGIGTNNPSGKLDIAYTGTGGSGTFGIGEGLNISSLSPNITFNDNSTSVDNYAVHLNQSVFTLGRYTSSTSQSPDLVLNAGRVGIGLTNPSTTLHVDGWARINGGLQLQGTNRQVMAIDNTSLLFGTNNTERMRIDASGNVGIGITGPTSKLHVYDTTNASQNLITNKIYSVGGAANGITRTGLDVETTRTGWSNSDSTSGNFKISINNRIGNSTLIGVKSLATIDVNNTYSGVSAAGSLTAFYGKVTTTFTTGSSPVATAYGLRIDAPEVATDSEIVTYYGAYINGASVSGTLTNKYALVTEAEAGNVGIGTTNPGAKLDVADRVEIDTYDAQATGNNAFTSGYLRIISGAKTGWGVDDQLGKIEFYGEDGSGIGARTAASIVAVCESGNGTTTTTFDSGLAFYTSPNNAAQEERMRIDSAGAIQFNSYDSTNQTGTPTYLLGTDASGNVVKTNTVPGSDPGPYLPLGGGTMIGDLVVDGASITIDTDIAGNSLLWTESDSSTVAGQLRGYANRGDIYLYSDGIKKTELSSQNDSFIPALHIGGTAAASGGVLQVTGDANISATVTATTFLGDLNGTINTVTTAVTKANSTNDTTVATTAFVQNLIGTIPAGLVFQGTWNAATNTPTLTSGTGTTGNFYIVSVDGTTNLDGITDWKVGDWAVFVEQGASDQWEKVDNSSVLDGSGTGNTVPLWAGSGTSNTLGNSIITQTGASPNQIIRITSNSDAQLRLDGAATSYAGIHWVDVSGSDYMWFNGSSGTFSIGGGGSGVSGKKLHIDGSTSIGSNYDAASPPTNGLLVEGNVGIGTINPLSRLHVVSGEISNGANKGIRIENYNGTKDYSIRTGVSGVNNTSLAIYDETAGANRMVIESGGNVGIGTTSPGEKLEVNGNTKVSGRLQVGAYTSSDSSIISQSGDIQLRVGSTNITNNPYIRLQGNSGTGNVYADIKLDTVNQLLVFNDPGTTGGTIGTNPMVLDAAGHVGIGTTNPSTDLQVAGTVRADVFGVQDDSTNPSGNTSTRVTSPAGATYDDQNNSASTGVLSVILPTTAASTMLSFTLRVFDYASNESFDVNVAGYWYSSGLWANTSVRIESQGNVERNFNVRFGKNSTTNKGWVGVGETTTQWSYVKFAVLNFQAAHVNDDLDRWDDLWDTAVLTSLTDYTTLQTKTNNQVNNWARSAENLYYGSGSGNVGIGTITPSSKLQVVGGIQMADDTDTASAAKVGTLKYRVSGNNSYVDMCMQTGVVTYEWVNIVQNNW